MNRYPAQTHGLPRRSQRRRFLQGAAGIGLAGVGLGLLADCRSDGESLEGVAPDAPLETTRLSLGKVPTVCFAPYYFAEELFRGEGFTDITYRPTQSTADLYRQLAAGDIDLVQTLGIGAILAIDAGNPVVILGGVHVGCYELFATRQISTIRDLKGKRVATDGVNTATYYLFFSLAAYVGLDPGKDFTWSFHPPAEAIDLLARGDVDAYLGLPPVPQELRARGIGHAILNTSEERPWSQYFCCVVAANQAFVRRNPVATRRALRAILKATDLCASAPDSVAQFLVDKGYSARLDYASQALHEIHYNRWRDYDPEDTVRFYALRLKEIGAIKSSPNDIIKHGTDWRLINELKKELKA